MERISTLQAEHARQLQALIQHQNAALKAVFVSEFTESQGEPQGPIPLERQEVTQTLTPGTPTITGKESKPWLTATPTATDLPREESLRHSLKTCSKASQLISGMHLKDVVEEKKLSFDNKLEAEIDKALGVLSQDEEQRKSSLGSFHVDMLRVETRISKHLSKFSCICQCLKEIGCNSCIQTEMPKSDLAEITQWPSFNLVCTLVILANTAVMGYESDVKIKAVMTNPPNTIPAWLQTCRIAFTVFYCAELLFRIVALRGWFFAHKKEWTWNAFDLFLVCVSIITEAISGLNFSFVRVVRVIRIIRVARIIRIFRFFRSLREMFLAILACLPSLIWACVFTAVWMFMFSIFILQGAYEYVDSLEMGAERVAMQERLAEFYSSLDGTMFTLLGAVTGGDDWFALREPLKPMGELYTGAFIIYFLVVTIGFMQILIGILAGNTASVRDRDLAVHKEDAKLDEFVKDMVELFKEFSVDSTGRISWHTFKKYITSPRVQAYLASHELDSSHANLLFHLLDEDKSGSIDIREWIVGLMKLKGEAKALDARIIERDLGIVKGQLDAMKAMLCISPALAVATRVEI